MLEQVQLAENICTPIATLMKLAQDARDAQDTRVSYSDMPPSPLLEDESNDEDNINEDTGIISILEVWYQFQGLIFNHSL